MYPVLTETAILQKIDQAFNGIPAYDYPAGNKEDIKYSFFLDLEHGYCETAGSCIHLYGDGARWAIVQEKCGYMNRGGNAAIQLDYIGNCITYSIEKYPERSYISNSISIALISGAEYERIANSEDAEDGMETFELISPSVAAIEVHGQTVNMEQDIEKYITLGIHPRDYDNPKRLVGFGDLVRYLSDTRPELVSATEQELRTLLPLDLPKLLMLGKFHYSSAYEKDCPPSLQEMYQLIAKVLVNNDPAHWQPILEPNNHWSNWESGNL
ncbi:MAG: hypothetical protein P0Y53_21500 [Candidatus Pseudobacter hemicellulosilyticus]|uniref:Uncharacterized protein n=1 Tax=Candidatus Pseudobacter hemicellulosilyticus TaxID=3121375 RepID=A0AAJ6BFG5_9BACT|nr:MAG: hypothetical protein P0Y53_21500 [Pseudobacter sp.]